MAIAVAFDLEIWAYDIKNTYVNIKLKNPIYYKLLSGNEMKGKGLKLVRALYRLKHSSNL